MNDQVMIVDDHPVMRMAVWLLLRNTGFDVVAQTGSGADALTMLETVHPDIAIIDLGIPGVDGLTLIEQIVANKWPVKSIILTCESAEHLVKHCRHIGAYGFVNKQHDLGDLLSALRAVQDGGMYFPSETSDLSEASREEIEYQRIESLSVRELRVLQLLVQGMTNKEIAACMLLSNNVVSICKKSLIHKLEVDNLFALVNLACRNKLI